MKRRIRPIFGSAAMAASLAATVVLKPATSHASGHGAASGHAAPAHAAPAHGEAEHGHSPTAAPDAESNGIWLGEFKVRTDYPVEAQKCTVRFILYASVDEKQRDKMRQFAAHHQQKIRDVVIIATRLAPLHVFHEPDLSKFRRRILIRLRHSLPELAIDDLYFSEYGLLVRSL